MEELTGQLVALLFVLAGMLFTPLVFIALDLWAGIRKAKKRGEKIMSNKLKRTMDKISKYYNSILAMLVVDAIQMGVGGDNSWGARPHGDDMVGKGEYGVSFIVEGL